MKGLEIAKNYYNEFGKQMIENEFSEFKNRICAALVGEGSECLGFDDEFSTDHDFEPGFCLFITKEDYYNFGFKLERAYSKLPNEYMGLKRNLLSPADGNRHGVIIIEEFYQRFLCSPEAPKSNMQWLYTPSSSLLSACNGEVFVDNLGQFNKVRNELKKGYPEDIRIKKLCANTIMMAQSGQYNYKRCATRGETGASQLAIFEFVKHTISAVYLLNNRYEPFYKWAYRGMRDLPILSELEVALSNITELGNSKTQVKEKTEIIEDISKMIIDEFKKQNLTDNNSNNLEEHAYSMTNKIKDNHIRNMHIMSGI